MIANLKPLILKARPSPRVNIVLSDRNWVLEKLGQALETRLPNITLADVADPSADINYYITFACRTSPMPTLEMALFTHMERSPELQNLFIETARDVDLAICQSPRYRDVLRTAGIDNTRVISPGVDRALFDVKIRIGVVGRTYHTGRKGEGLVEQLMDMENIDWHFSGTGWPQPGRHIAPADLPDFYRSMDYILVPALYEGGPMCVPEALAVGTPVIASDVGWVGEFPHIPFNNGDADDLRRVLQDLVAQKQILRASTQDYTWDVFAQNHAQAFADVMRVAGKTAQGRKRKTADKTARTSGPDILTANAIPPVRLVTHGDEKRALGGPTLRVPRTAHTLRDLGVQAQASAFAGASDISEDVVHLFNIWNPDTALQTMKQLKHAGKKVVFSPIYLDLTRHGFWGKKLPELPLGDLDSYDQAYRRAQDHVAGRGRLYEPVPGYNAMVRDMLHLADHVIFLSQSERDALARLGAQVEDARASLIHNPVDIDIWQETDPQIFRDAHLRNLAGPSDYVVCVGRIEERKNQLLLARTLRDLPVRLVLIGHIGNPAYAAQVQRVAGPDFLHVDRLHAGGDMLRSALSGAQAFCLPSWAEGASLAALEAAAIGSPMVLSDRSSEREYFGDLAEYCDVGDLHSIHDAVQACLDRPAADTAARADQLKQRVAEQYSWGNYAQKTAQAYATTAKAPPRTTSTPDAVPADGQAQVVFDVTLLAHRTRPATGIARVQDCLAQALCQSQKKVRFVCWHGRLGQFIDVPDHAANDLSLQRYCAQYDGRTDLPEITLPPQAVFVGVFDSCLDIAGYAYAVEDLKARSRCSVIGIVGDLAPFHHPFWFEPDTPAAFQRAFHRLGAICDHILTLSEHSAAQTRKILEPHSAYVPQITTLHLGDMHPEASAEDNATSHASATTPLRDMFRHRRFVLATGPLHPGQNYEMLVRVWARMKQTHGPEDLHLVILGGVTPAGQTLATQIARDPRVASHIHILPAVAPADRVWFQDTCLFTVFPALDAGHALPVYESLSRGKLCLAAGFGAAQEISAELVEHIDPEDFTTWAHKISYFAQSTAAREVRADRIRKNHRATPWADAARALVSHAQTAHRLCLADPVYAGQRVQVGEAGAALQVLFDANWHPRTADGRWTRARQSCVTINLSRLRDATSAQHIDVLVQVDLCLGVRDLAKRLSIRTGEHVLFDRAVWQDNAPCDIILPVPVAALDGAGQVTLAFDMPVSAPLPAAPADQVDDEKGPEAEARQTVQGVCLRTLTALDRDHSNPLHAVTCSEIWSTGQHGILINLGDPQHRCATAPHCTFSQAWGVGSQTGSCHIWVPVLPGAGAQRLTLTCRPVATRQTPVHAEIFWNGRALAHACWRDDRTVEIDVLLNEQDMAGAAPHLLSVVSDGVLLPVDLGLGPTESIAGVGVFDLRLDPQEGQV